MKSLFTKSLLCFSFLGSIGIKNTQAQQWEAGFTLGATANINRGNLKEIIRPTIGFNLNKTLHKRFDIEANLIHFNTGKTQRRIIYDLIEEPEYPSSHDKGFCLVLNVLGKYNFISRKNIRVYGAVGINSVSVYNKFYDDFETTLEKPANFRNAKLDINGANHLIVGLGTAINLNKKMVLNIQPSISSPLNRIQFDPRTALADNYYYCLHLQTGLGWRF